MKFIRQIIWLSLFIIMSTACSSLMPRQIVQSDDEFRKNIRTVILLPLYYDEELLPKTSLKSQDDYFPLIYREKFCTTMENKKDLVNNYVKGILMNGKYKLSILMPVKDSGFNSIVKKDIKYLKGQLADTANYFGNNREYSLSPEGIRNLATQYQADAVYFHYLQVIKQWVHYSWGGFSSTNTYVLELPQFALVYHGILYDKNGNLLFPHDDLILSTPSPMRFESFSPLYDGIILLDNKIEVGKGYLTELVPIEKVNFDKIEDRIKTVLSNRSWGGYLLDFK